MSEKREFELGHDESGNPILLATRAPGQVAAQNVTGGVVRRGARSGNPNSDPGSGQFTGPGGRTAAAPEPEVVAQTRTLPQGVTQEMWERRLDTVRDAARELDDMGAGDAKEFLRGRPNIVMSQVNIDLFLQDVRAQRMDDLLDILDSQLRSRVQGMRRSRRFVRVAAPKGWTTRVFAGLDDEEVLTLVKRLEGKGWDPGDLKKHVISRVNDEGRRTKLEQLYGERPKKKGKKTT